MKARPNGVKETSRARGRGEGFGAGEAETHALPSGEASRRLVRWFWVITLVTGYARRVCGRRTRRGRSVSGTVFARGWEVRTHVSLPVLCSSRRKGRSASGLSFLLLAKSTTASVSILTGLNATSLACVATTAYSSGLEPGAGVRLRSAMGTPPLTSSVTDIRFPAVVRRVSVHAHAR